jgi:ABC-type transport system substrate-binding protein
VLAKVEVLQLRYKNQVLLSCLAISLILFISLTTKIHDDCCNFERNQVISQNTTNQVFHPGLVDTIKVVEYNSLDEALTALNSGTADIFGHMIEATDYETLENYPNVELQWAYDTEVCMIAINALAYPLENQHVRRAIAFAINKTAIAEEAMNSTVDLVDFLLPLNNEFCIEYEEGGEFYNSNPIEATDELGRAGILDVDADGVVEAPNGSEFTLNILYPFDKAGLIETASILSANLFSIGLNNTLIPMAYDELQTEIANHSGTFDLALYHEEIPEFGLGEMATTFEVHNIDIYGKNIARINNEVLNELAIQYMQNVHLDKADEYGIEAIRAIKEICPIVPLFFYRWLSVYSEQRFDGWVNEVTGGSYSAWNPISVTANNPSENELVVAVLPSFFDTFFLSLNPFYAGLDVDHDWLVKNQFNPYMLIYDSPLATLPDGRAVPRSSTSWTMHYLLQDHELNNSETRSVFYCDPNAVWADGEAMDAQDYRFTHEYYSENSLTNLTARFVDVKVTGDYVAAITLNDLGMFNYRRIGMLPILPEHIWQTRDPRTWNPEVQDVVGSGPYSVSEFTPGSELVLSKNDLYYPEVDDDPPTLRTIFIVPENPIPAESVSFRVYVDDRSKIQNVTISYVYIVGRINFTESQIMREGSTGYEATIPSRVTANKIAYKIIATDIWENTAVIVSGSYERQTSETELEWWQDSTIVITIVSVIIAVIIIGFIIKRRK